MKNTFCLNFIFFLILAFSSFTSLSQSVKVDFTGITLFWAIEEKLSADQLPDSIAWKNLFDAPFYKFYTNWGQERHMKRLIINAFMPSKQKSRDSLINEGKWSKEIINHLLKARLEKTRINSYVTELMKRNLFKEAKEKASPYLPTSALSQELKVTIGFGLYHPQSNASDSAIAVDLLSVEKESLVEIIGHEIHHFYTFAFRKKLTLSKKDEAEPLLNTIFQLQLEGIADMINTEWFLANPEKSIPFLYNTYSEHYNNPSKNLEQVDVLLKAIVDTPALMKKNAILIRDLFPLGAHPHGYYMAKTILNAKGKKALLKVLSNPFDFLRLYNKIAKKSNNKFCFSEKSMQLFEELEKKYVSD